MASSEGSATILVVDDEPEVADAYALRLRMEYDDVETAYGGQEAIDAVSEDTDVILLDRRMPEVSGDDVLDAVRERGLDCGVIMVTAVTPDFDLIEMPFDDYLCKPVDKEDLFDAIEQQIQATEYDDRMSEFFSVTSKISVLEVEKTDAQLEDSEEYQELLERRDELQAEMDDTVDDFDDVTDAFQAIGRSG
ncbi:MAG: HalX domain-containing protein [Halobacteriales archaeon]